MLETFGTLDHNQELALSELNAGVGSSNSLICGGVIIQIMLVSIFPIMHKEICFSQ